MDVPSMIEQAVNNVTMDVWTVRLMCVALMVVVVVPCMTLLIYRGKVGTLVWKKGVGLVFEAVSNGNELALMLLEELLDKAEHNFTRRMLALSDECFKDNQEGQRYATRMIALNHCMRDVSSLGFNNYINNAKQMGRWTDAETECFAEGFLVAARGLVDARLDAYEKCSSIKQSDTFRKISQGKIEKNIHYSTIINYHLESRGMGSGTIKEGHARRSSILINKQIK